MKLKCDKHNRRVTTTSVGFRHKTGGDPRSCDSRTASIGTQTFGWREAHAIPIANAVKNH